MENQTVDIISRVKNRDQIKKIVMQMLEEIQEDSIGSGRSLFWHPLKGVFSTWILMTGKRPMASVWLDAADGLWHYSIPIYNVNSYEEFRTDAMANVETRLANDDTLDRE